MESEPTEKLQNTMIESVLEFLQLGGFGVIGESLFAFRAPNYQEHAENVWSVMPIGGKKKHTNVTGEDVKIYNFAVRYCCKNTFDLNRQLYNLDKYITASKCYNLKDFATIGIEVLSSNDTPYLDDEERWVGEVTVQTTVYNILQEYSQESDSSTDSDNINAGDKDKPTESDNSSTGNIS